MEDKERSYEADLRLYEALYNCLTASDYQPGYFEMAETAFRNCTAYAAKASYSLPEVAMKLTDLAGKFMFLCGHDEEPDETPWILACIRENSAHTLHGLSKPERNCDRKQDNLPGFVYAAKVSDGMVKIGRSKCPRSRLSSMSIRSLIKFTDTYISDPTHYYVKIELELHEFFADKRRTGEWFDITFEEAVEAIKTRVEQFADLRGRTLVPALTPPNHQLA